MPEIVH